MRRLLPVVVATVLLLASGCGGSSDAPSSDASPKDSCPGGDIRFLQGAPTKLPGGGSGGIGAVHLDDDPPTVRLALAGESGPAPDADDLPVGGTFTVDGTTYKVTAICRSKVTASQVG